MYISLRQLVHVAAAKKKWTIASARQHFSELVGMSAREPQSVYRRNRLVATVVSPAVADEAETLHRPGLAQKLAELQRLCAEESYELRVPARQTRPDQLVSRRARGRSRKQPGQKR